MEKGRNVFQSMTEKYCEFQQQRNPNSQSKSPVPRKNEQTFFYKLN